MGAIEKRLAMEGSDSFEYGLDKSDLGRPGTLRYNVLSLVLSEKYEEAIEEMTQFGNRKSAYPDFASRTGRFVKHSQDLIHAIKTKRSFPGFNSLTRARQQELRERFKYHFKELHYCLKVIEKIQYDLRIQDVRSTVYVLKSAVLAVCAICLVGLSMDFFYTMGPSAWTLINANTAQWSSWVTDRFMP